MITNSKGSVPMGTIVAFFLDPKNIPSGWLLCNGTTIPAQYTKLITALGTNCTPNLAGRTLIGTGSPNTSQQSDGTTPNFDPSNNWPLAYTGGEYQHTLITNEMPEHAHNCDNEKNSDGNNNGLNVFVVGHGVTGTTKKGGVNIIPQGFGGGGLWTSVGSTYTTDNTGASLPHNNMQPYQAVNYIIYTGQDS